MTLEEIIARCEASAATEERKMVLALAKHVRGDAPQPSENGDERSQSGDKE